MTMSFKLTGDERRHLQSLADALDVNPSEVLRMLIRGASVKG